MRTINNKHVVIITHDDVGHALLNTVRKTLGNIPLPTSIITITAESNPDHIREELAALIEQMDPNLELLVLTDLYGSTPSNIAHTIAHQNTRIVAGLNLPMLIRVMNYPELNLEHLANKALTGGRDGIMNCKADIAC